MWFNKRFWQNVLIKTLNDIFCASSVSMFLFQHKIKSLFYKNFITFLLIWGDIKPYRPHEPGHPHILQKEVDSRDKKFSLAKKPPE